MRDSAKDIVDILAAAGLGLTAGSNLYVGKMPEADDPNVTHKCAAVMETGGGAPDAMNGGEALYSPTCQVRVRGDREDPAVGLVLAKACISALDRTSPSPYVSIRVRESSPLRMPNDAANRPIWVFNVEAVYKETAGVPPALQLETFEVAAEDVTVEPAGNLAATDAQAALEELQADIDTLGDGLADAEEDIAGLVVADTDIDTRLDAVEATAANAVLLTGNQTVAGAKTFSSAIKVPTPASAGQYFGSGTTGWIAIDDGFGTRVKYGATSEVRVTSGGTTLIGSTFAMLNGEIEFQTASKGIIMKSPNGTRYRVTVSDAGALVVTAA